MPDVKHRKRVISVIGSSTPSKAVYTMAREVGRLLADRGFVVACGGRGGVMEAVCRGATERGGTSIGFLPGGIGEANSYVTIPVPTGMGEARNTLVVSSGEAIISIGGAFGTLSEIGFALKLGKPVVGLETWEAFEKDGSHYPDKVASSPEEAVKMVVALLDGDL